MSELQEVYLTLTEIQSLTISEEDCSSVPLAFQLVLLVQHVS